MKKVCFPSAMNTFRLLFRFTRCRYDLKHTSVVICVFSFHFSIRVLLITIFFATGVIIKFPTIFRTISNCNKFIFLPNIWRHITQIIVFILRRLLGLISCCLAGGYDTTQSRKCIFIDDYQKTTVYMFTATKPEILSLFVTVLFRQPGSVAIFTISRSLQNLTIPTI